MHNKLLLGSKSRSRQQLLRDANIPFEIVEQDAQEGSCNWGLPLVKLVEQIALYKMDHVKLPIGHDGQFCFVLTADTLSQDADGTIQGKPIDHADAIEKIKSARTGSIIATAFCLDRKIYQGGRWEIEKRIIRVVTAGYLFVVPDDWIEYYLKYSQGFISSNAIAVEGYGAQFLKQVSGSYSVIVGLPMFELREALGELNFFAVKN
jgi:septum formation protein